MHAILCVHLIVLHLTSLILSVEEYNVEVVFVNSRVIKCKTYNMISGFRRNVDETCVLVGYYAASRGNWPIPMAARSKA
jgi:hypothetical protein